MCIFSAFLLIRKHNLNYSKVSEIYYNKNVSRWLWKHLFVAVVFTTFYAALPAGMTQSRYRRQTGILWYFDWHHNLLLLLLLLSNTVQQIRVFLCDINLIVYGYCFFNSTLLLDLKIWAQCCRLEHNLPTSEYLWPPVRL